MIESKRRDNDTIKIIDDNVIDLESGEVLGKSMTIKQRRVVNMIEENLHIKFKGYTTIEARDFISKNINESKAVNRKHWDDLDFEETHKYNEKTDSWESIDPRDDWSEEDYWEDYADRCAFDPNFS